MAAREGDETNLGTVGICLLASLVEGIDNQSTGVALPRLVPEFGLSPSQAGMVAAASVLGLLIGAALGGRAADRIGRRKVLIASMLALGAGSLLTTVAPNYSILLLVRLLTGLGLGGAFPNLIAMCGEAVPARFRATAIGLMYCGMPLGGMAASATGLLPGDWRPVFYLGGFGPLLVALVMVFSLPESQVFRRISAEEAELPPASRVLFGEGRAPATLLLWTGYFFTLLVLYLLLNWLPSLLIGKGLSRPEAFTASILLNLGGALGSAVFGILLDKGKGRWAACGVYLGLALSMAGLGAFHGVGPLIAAAAVAGFCVIGGQLILYALTPPYYPARVRATGTGAAVAAGRLGSLTGPIAAGALLGGGASAATVLSATVPGMVLALAAVVLVQFRPTAAEA
jgi:AAHS family 3-hydroxyphenylpropionic acid transporter